MENQNIVEVVTPIETPIEAPEPIRKVKKEKKEKIPTGPIGRPKLYEEGWHQRCKDTKYNTKYYHQTNKEMDCPICGTKTTKRTLAQHQRSVKCQLVKLNITLN